MLEIITHFFEKHISIRVGANNNEENIRAASAALLMEMMHAEEVCSDEKHRLILNLLEKSFNLTEEQALALMSIAEHKRKHATDYFEFTHLINVAFSREQKLQLIESLWRIAFVDNNVDIDEEYLIDKVARLLIIPHSEVVQAKNRIAG